MKEIQLSQGKVALVDDDDFGVLNQYVWSAYKDCHTFYAVGRFKIRGNRKMVKMHHIIIGHPLPGYVCDHIDGNGLNNQRHNLRFLTYRESCLNRRNVSRMSKYPGVVWMNKQKKWASQLWIKGKHKYLGLYSTEEDAFIAYMTIVKKENPQFNTNFRIFDPDGIDALPFKEV
jgi:hypothetical protein